MALMKRLIAVFIVGASLRAQAPPALTGILDALANSATIFESSAPGLKQTSVSQGLAVFDERTGDLQRTEGKIWLREDDLIPLRITLTSERLISKKDVVGTEAEVAYSPSQFGLAPSSVAHRQFLNHDLLVENLFSYSGYQRPGKP
jgi:hypothetical protein